MGKVMTGTEYGSCSLLIYGDYLDFREIGERLGITATRIVEKGTPVLRSGSTSLGFCETNGWFYDVTYENQSGFSTALGTLLSQIHPQKDRLKMLVETIESTNIFISVSVSSDYAQMSLEIGIEHQKLISELGFPLRFSILSFGRVENED